MQNFRSITGSFILMQHTT